MILLCKALTEKGWDPSLIVGAVANRLGMKRRTVEHIWKEHDSARKHGLPPDVEALLTKTPKESASPADASPQVPPSVTPIEPGRIGKGLGAEATEYITFLEANCIKQPPCTEHASAQEKAASTHKNQRKASLPP